MSSYWSPAAFRCSQARCHYHHTGACFVCKQVWRRSWNVHESAAAAAVLNSRISCPVPPRDGTEWESCRIDVDSFTSWCLREKKKSIKKMTCVGFFFFHLWWSSRRTSRHPRGALLFGFYYFTTGSFGPDRLPAPLPLIRSLLLKAGGPPPGLITRLTGNLNNTAFARRVQKTSLSLSAHFD